MYLTALAHVSLERLGGLLRIGATSCLTLSEVKSHCEQILSLSQLTVFGCFLSHRVQCPMGLCFVAFKLILLDAPLPLYFFISAATNTGLSSTTELY